MLNLLPRIYSTDSFKNLEQHLQSSEKILISGCYGSLNAITARFLSQTFNRPFVFISPDDKKIENFYEDIIELSGKENAVYFPAISATPYEDRAPNPGLMSLRVEALSKIASSNTYIAAVSGISLCDKISSPENVQKSIVHLKVGDEYPLDFLIEELTELGFERVDMVDQMGEYAVRGGIVDVFSWGGDVPVRLEYFGDEIESIRVFDVLSQRSVERIERTEILGSSNAVSGKSTSILNHLHDAIIWIDERHIIENRLQEREEKVKLQYLKHAEEDKEIIEPGNFYFMVDDIVPELEKKAQLFSGYDTRQDFHKVDLGSEEPLKFAGNIQKLPEFIENAGKKWKTLYVFSDIQDQADRLLDIFDEDITIASIAVKKGGITSGFAISEIGMMILTYHQLFRQMRRRKIVKKVNSASYLRVLRSIQYGDLVVHVDYGLGLFRGLEKLKVGGNHKECVHIEYAGGESLYVHFENLNKIHKYSSEEGIRPGINSLSSKSWDREKSKTRKAVEKIAAELVEIYAQRVKIKGHAFSTDSKWQSELEASFPYQDTPDQVTATEDVKKDMEKSEPMDRLICGDVGFGKTEIAIRAAFKAVQDSKQVAILVPTTILASQHFETFSQRLRDFPVAIGILSRFSTPKEQKETIVKLKAGQIDIIIGTHRLLSEDISFKDLGLLVVDEEQRFGVKHKEKIKQLRLNVDILSMSATPIPRTLQMSLLGVQGLSNIETPPRNRLPILTKIIQWDDDRIYEIVNDELSRDGQIFFVHNRVETIEAIKNIMHKIIPKAKIAVAHGQMPERKLETVMRDFKEKKYDILIATMIIENGLDIPSSNTIIINHADKFGLSQLYQLRGRVGRSYQQAYAYLIAPHYSQLTDVAMKRLHVIEEFTDLGAGFKLALRDLEIRGAGNLLGHQQSGFINAVGFEMYVKILNEEIETLKTKEYGLPEQKKTTVIETKLDIDADLYFPQEYIENSNERMAYYHKMLYAKDLQQLGELTEELEDRFGKMPDTGKILLSAFACRVLALKLFINKIYMKKNTLKLFIDIHSIDETDLSVLNFEDFVKSSYLLDVQFAQDKELILKATIKGLTIHERLENLKKLFLTLVP